MKDIGMMMSRVKANQAEQSATNQYHDQPQFEGDKNLRREESHRQRQQKWYQVTKFKDTIFLEYRIVSRKD